MSAFNIRIFFFCFSNIQERFNCYSRNLVGCPLWQSAGVTLDLLSEGANLDECNVQLFPTSFSDDQTDSAFQCLRTFTGSFKESVHRPSHGVIDICRHIDALNLCMSETVRTDGFPHEVGKALMYTVKMLMGASSARCEHESKSNVLVKCM